MKQSQTFAPYYQVGKGQARHIVCGPSRVMRLRRYGLTVFVVSGNHYDACRVETPNAHFASPHGTPFGDVVTWPCTVHMPFYPPRRTAQTVTSMRILLVCGCHPILRRLVKVHRPLLVVVVSRQTTPILQASQRGMLTRTCKSPLPTCPPASSPSDALRYSRACTPPRSCPEINLNAGGFRRHADAAGGLATLSQAHRPPSD